MTNELDKLKILVESSCLHFAEDIAKPIEAALKENQERIEELEETNHLMFLREHENTKKLKALEIIKKKRVEIRVIFHTTNAMEYNEKTRQYYDCQPLTKEEYDLLKGGM